MAQPRATSSTCMPAYLSVVDLLLYGAAGDEPVDGHGAALTNAPRTLTRLHISAHRRGMGTLHEQNFGNEHDVRAQVVWASYTEQNNTHTHA